MTLDYIPTYSKYLIFSTGPYRIVSYRVALCRCLWNHDKTYAANLQPSQSKKIYAGEGEKKTPKNLKNLEMLVYRVERHCRVGRAAVTNTRFEDSLADADADARTTATRMVWWMRGEAPK